MTQPLVTVEAAFGSSMFDAAPSWTDISAYFRSGSTARGRASVDQRFETGTASLVLDNRDGRFTADNPSSPYYPDVKIGVPIRVTAEWETVTYPVFYGTARSWPPDYPTGNIESTVVVPLADGFYNLNLEDLAGESFDAQPTDERIIAVLDAIGWPAALRDIDDGVATVQATDFAQPGDGGEQPALAHLLDVAESEVGVLFMGPDGKVTFRNRVAMSAIVSAATFDGTDDYSEIGLRYDDSILYNDIRVAREDGIQVTFVNAASVSAHGRRVLTRDVMPMGNDPEVLNVAEWLSALFGEQRLRIEGLKFKPLKSTALMASMLDLDLRDAVTIQMDPPGVDALSQLSAIEHIRHEIRPQDWTTVWSVIPLTDLEQREFWILGTHQLDISTRLA
jgi:hypothetical protein